MKYRFLSHVTLAAIALAAAIQVASPASASWNPCKPNDTLIGNGDASAVGSFAIGALCQDHVTTGQYWGVEVYDTAPDSKCAHAVVQWVKPDGSVDNDYGMWLCDNGSSKVFFTGVRNWTRYSRTQIGAFIDNGPTTWGTAKIY